jgi:hypothetical protein
MTRARAHRSAFMTLVCLLAITSCRTASGPATNKPPANDTVASTVPPFKTKEPERYSATRTITTMGPRGEKFVESWVIGRDELIRRDEGGSEQARIVYLDSPQGRYILWPEKKVYAVVAGDFGDPPPRPEDEADAPDRLLHMDPTISTFQPLGVETVAGRNAAKFRVVVNSSETESVNSSETLIWIDSALNMPIKGEMKTRDGTVVVNELSDINLQPDKQLFQIPAGYEKIAYSALQKQLKALGANP